MTCQLPFNSSRGDGGIRSASLDIFVRFAPKISQLPDPRSSRSSASTPLQPAGFAATSVRIPPSLAIANGRKAFAFRPAIAETEGFEPSRAFTLPPFQGGALDHYATSPYTMFSILPPFSARGRIRLARRTSAGTRPLCDLSVRAYTIPNKKGAV